MAQNIRVTGGALRGVWSALRARQRKVNERRKSLRKGKSSPENKCNNLTPDK